MTPTKRQSVVLAALAGAAVLAGLLVSYEFMTAQCLAAQNARDSLAEARSVADQIRAIRGRPATVAEHERLTGEMTTLIESASRTATIPPASLRRITPETPRRVGDTVYKLKPTQILLQPVSLKQLVLLSTALREQDPGLNIETMRLSVPRELENGDLWTAELVLTYLIYDPPQAGKSENAR